VPVALGWVVLAIALGRAHERRAREIAASASAPGARRG